MTTKEFTLNEKMAELCGVISGDGNIWTNLRKYEVTITGNPKDREYLDSVRDCATTEMGLKPYYRIRGRGLRLTIYSKAFFKFLVNVVGFKAGVDKNKGGVPGAVLGLRILRLAYVRGLFDTDGSVFTSAKKGVSAYPTIEITNENLKLLLDIRKILDEEGFRTTLRKSNKETYKIALHGVGMVGRWLGTIGSSHPRKRSKMESIIKTSG